MTREMKNPGALAGAAGAYQRRLGKADIAGPAGAVQGRKSRKQDEPFRDAWIKAARRMVASRKTILRDADFVACGAIFELMQEDGRFFMPYERLSGPDGAGCSRSQAANMLARLRTAGLIRDAEVPLLRKKTSKPGRVSPTYQAAIPAISSSPAGELSGAISSTGVDEIGGDFVQIARRNSGRAGGISSTDVDPITYIIEDPDAWRSEVEAETAADMGEAVRSCAPTPPAPDLADGAPDLDTSCIVDETIAGLGDAAWHQAQAEARVDAPPHPQVVSRGPDVQRQDPETGRAERDPRVAAYHASPDADAAFRSLYSRWLKRGGENEARQAFLSVLASGVEFEEIARGAAAYIADRQRDRRGPAAAVQYCKPLARWLQENGWETWGPLADAERQAEREAATEYDVFLMRARDRDARRKSMPF